MAHAVTAPRLLMEQYRAAFVGADLPALVDFFVFPLHVVSATAGHASRSVVQAEQWPGILNGLLNTYTRLGVTECVPLEMRVVELSDSAAVAHAHWELRRADGAPVYDFTAVYTLVLTSGRFRIAAVAHDELPKMQAALQAP